MTALRYFAYKQDGRWRLIDGPFEVDGIQYPHNWVELATPEERTQNGIEEVDIDLGTPPNSYPNGQYLTEIDGKPALRMHAVYYTRQEATQMLWDRIKRERDRRIDLGAPTPMGRFDANDTGRVNIAGAVQMAQILGDRFTIHWTLHDNSVATFNAAQMIQAGMLVGQFYSAQHVRSQEMRTVIPTISTAAMFDLDLAAWWDGEEPEPSSDPVLPSQQTGGE